MVWAVVSIGQSRFECYGNDDLIAERDVGPLQNEKCSVAFSRTFVEFGKLHSKRRPHPLETQMLDILPDSSREKKRTVVTPGLRPVRPKR